MREVTISSTESGQRLDKYLKKYLDKAGSGFIYKMLRKKNIVLNGKKAAGNELLVSGDVVKMFLSEETIDKFTGGRRNISGTTEKNILNIKCTGNRIICGRYSVDILYEDDNIIFLNKPAGLLSQKADRDDVSLVDIFTAYMRDNAVIGYNPGICNRLDRNTSGIVAAGKSVAGLQKLSEAIRDRRVKKLYHCIVCGKVISGEHLIGYLVKDTLTNKVTIYDDNNAAGVLGEHSISARKADYIETIYRPIGTCDVGTILEVELITGKTHQIRAHLAMTGHPVVGDVKYGAPRRKDIKHHMLHAYEMRFGEEDGVLAGVSEATITAPYPAEFRYILESAHNA